MRTVLTLCSALFCASLAPAQDLRRGLVDADVVVVGRAVNRTTHGDAVALYRVQVIADVRGADANRAVTVLDWPKLSLHNRPTVRQQRLYCLADASVAAERLGLPQADGPYYKLVGWSGSHPLIGEDLAKDPLLRFARLLAAREDGADPIDTANALAAMALEPTPALRTEAVRFLAEQGALRAKLTSVHWNQLLARATGEAEDIDYKIALAELCCEQRLDSLLDALAVSLSQVTSPEFARCVGRIGRTLHGEQAADKLLARLQQAGRDQDRRMLLLALGATNTDAALQTLLRMDRTDPAVLDALKEHRAPAAQEAAGRRKQ